MGITAPNTTFDFCYQEIKKQNHFICGEIRQIKEILTGRTFSSKTILLHPQINQSKICHLQSMQASPFQNFVNLRQISSLKSTSTFCLNENAYQIVFDDVDLSLDYILEQRQGQQFTQKQLLNLIINVLNGLMKIQQMKNQIFPLCEKSIFVHHKGSFLDPGSLEEAVFKVLPIELAELSNYDIEKLKVYTSPQSNSQTIFSTTYFSPKAYIFSLGSILLDLITEPVRKQTEISFQELVISESKKNQIGKEQLLSEANVSHSLTNLVLSMIEPNERMRVGLVTLYDECQRLLNSFNQSNFNTFNSCKMKTYSALKVMDNRQSFPSKKFSKKTKKRIESIKLQETDNSDPNLASSNFQRVQFDNGAVYVGSINENGQFQGRGTLYYPSKEPCYEGEWKRNLFCGYGHLYNGGGGMEGIGINFVNFSKNMRNCWKQYKGNFLNDKKNGKGVLYFQSGQKFEGRFRNDVIDGEGKFIQKDGKVFPGVWKNNHLLSIKK